MLTWAALIGLGAFHGLNPAMGWLFAVALGMQRQSTRAVLLALPPIAIGHALSIAAVVVVLAWLQSMIELRPLRIGAAALLIAFGAYRLIARHRGRVGMQVNFAELTLWSFLMASAHGAGLMLVPVLLNLNTDEEMAHSMHAHVFSGSLRLGVAAVVVHTAAMLVVAGAVALVVYRWVGLAFLRRGWINVDLVWSIALIAVAAVLLVSGGL